MKLKQIIFFIYCLGAIPLWSQNVISGKITDQSGQSLQGVNIIVKDSNTGVSSDFDGNFSIDTQQGQVLIFSYLGYKSQEITITDQRTLNIVLEEDFQQLDDIVVVGYGTKKKRDVISAISKVETSTLQKSTGAAFTDALQGNVSGLQLSSSGGDPTADTRILIRGTGSITTDTEPLIIIDGIPVASGGTSPLNYLNPSDIESISVLKDASATSIYGSRGANGVILVTTKSGKKGSSTFNLSVETGVTSPINEVELANANDWRSIISTARTNSGLDPNTDIVSAQAFLIDKRQEQRYIDENLYQTGNTNWVDKLQQNGLFKQYGLSASAGTDKASYYISGQYRSQEGNIATENFDRYTARLNLDFAATDFLKLGVRYNVVYEDNDVLATNQNQVDFNDPIINRGVHTRYSTLYSTALPIYPETYSNGDPFEPLSGNNLTYLLDDSRNVNNVKTLRNIGSVYASLEPVKDLFIKFDAGISNVNSRTKQFLGVRGDLLTEDDLLLSPTDQLLLDHIYENGPARNYNRESKTLTYNLSGTISYSKTFNEDHNLSVLLGIEQNHSQSRLLQLDFENAQSLNDPTELGFNVRDGEQLLEVRSQVGAEVRFFSQFGRLNYNYKNKYYFQGTLRRDGSSKFTPDDRFSIFPSLSAGWVVSSEDFYNSELINYLKVRGGYGKTGNANISPFLYFDNYLTWPNYPDRTGAFIIDNLGASPIEWEKSTTIDVALEFGLLKNRISGSLGYYNTKTTDLLLSFPTSYSIGIYRTSGDATSLANIGSIKNTGFELELRSINISANNFKWSTNFNISTNKNEVVELYPGFDNSDPTAFSFGDVTGLNEGSLLGEYYLPEFAGYDANGNTLIRDLATGDAILSTPTSVNSNRVLQGKSGLPTYYGGLSNTFSYKGLSLDVLFSFQGGHYILDNFGLDNVGIGSSVLRKDLLTQSFQDGNQNAYYNALSWNTQSIPLPGESSTAVSNVTTNKLHKGDMIRLRNITIGYDFNKGDSKLFKNNNVIKNVNLYLKLQNVATFSKFNITDPETLNSGDALARNLGQGVLSGVPRWQVMTTSFGINLTF